MICPKCGKRIEDDSLFCMYCGNNITATASEVRSKPKSYTRGDIALIAATIFFVLLGVILGTSMLSENSESQKNGSANIQVKIIKAAHCIRLRRILNQIIRFHRNIKTR